MYNFNYSSAPNCNIDNNSIKNNINNYIKNILVPKHFKGREFSYLINKWQQEFLDDLENYCSQTYSNYKFYFWCALYSKKEIAFNSSSRTHFYSETDVKISLYIETENIGIDIGGMCVKHLNLSHKSSINDYKTEIRNKIEYIINKILEGRKISLGSSEGTKYINYILEDTLEFLKSKDKFPYYYVVGTIFYKNVNYSICERYFKQTSNYGTVFFNYQNNSIHCNVHVFSCI